MQMTELPSRPSGGAQHHADGQTSVTCFFLKDSQTPKSQPSALKCTLFGKCGQLTLVFILADSCAQSLERHVDGP